MVEEIAPAPLKLICYARYDAKHPEEHNVTNTYKQARASARHDIG
jgi:hypothetical protein